jgi:hypothetical protein
MELRFGCSEGRSGGEVEMKPTTERFLELELLLLSCFSVLRNGLR